MKTVWEILNSGIDILCNANIENGKNEAFWILESLGIPKSKLILDRSFIPEKQTVNKFFDIIFQRTQGVPLQYLLGEWDFCSFTFKVGKGVLIPRPETEMLVELACKYLQENPNGIVYDLCAGSGCIGISIAKLNPDCTVYMVEKSDIASDYIKKNIKALEVNNAHLVQGDIFKADEIDLPSADILISNPPYISSSEISRLQREVLHEPVMALDGGEDGLDFYRAIADGWLKKVADGGLVALECAEEQTLSVSGIISGFCIEVKENIDIYGQPRVVTAKKKG